MYSFRQREGEEKEKNLLTKLQSGHTLYDITEFLVVMHQHSTVAYWGLSDKWFGKESWTCWRHNFIRIPLNKNTNNTKG